ncbi:hypothetical protein [Nannocystis pusilla]|uniref:hypothetical protein n=1 Tax=Nannocystis pusilla TaxID=889268 RepID=UPI003B7AE7B9
MHTNRLAWERWRIEPAPEGRVLLTSVAHGLHLGVRPDGSVYTHANTLDWEQWTISPLSPIVRYTYTSGGYRVWTDLHSGGNQDVSFFAPYTAGPFRKIGEHVQRSHDIAMHQAVMVVDAQPGILAPPLDYECVWTDKGSGAMFNGSVWRPIPRPGTSRSATSSAATRATATPDRSGRSPRSSISTTAASMPTPFSSSTPPSPRRAGTSRASTESGVSDATS